PRTPGRRTGLLLLVGRTGATRGEGAEERRECCRAPLVRRGTPGAALVGRRALRPGNRVPASRSRRLREGRLAGRSKAPGRSRAQRRRLQPGQRGTPPEQPR